MSDSDLGMGKNAIKIAVFYCKKCRKIEEKKLVSNSMDSWPCRMSRYIAFSGALYSLPPTPLPADSAEPNTPLPPDNPPFLLIPHVPDVFYCIHTGCPCSFAVEVKK